MSTTTVSRRFTNKNGPIGIVKREGIALAPRANKEVTEKNVLNWSRSAKKLHRSGKLSKLA